MLLMTGQRSLCLNKHKSKVVIFGMGSRISNLSLQFQGLHKKIRNYLGLVNLRQNLKA